MAYVITDHAKLRMQRRGISESQVRETIEQPEMAWTDKYVKQRRIHVRAYGQRRLKVVWTPDKHDVYVVTALWLEEGSKP